MKEAVEYEKKRKNAKWIPKINLNEGLDMCISTKRKHLKDREQ